MNLAIVILLCGFQLAHCASKDLYNTKTATNDLKWTSHPQDGWEEVSGLDRDANTIRYNQVCNTDPELEQQDNWVRSPYIDAENAKLVYLDIEYTMMKCDNCKETFTLYHYESSSDVASSTFPPWREHPYKKIDKVAAGHRFNLNSQDNGGINDKTFTIGPLRRNGLYIAAQDQGACMALMSVRVYYYYCPETTHQLAYFPNTIAGAEIASLIAVNGRCVSNAEYGSEVPKYRCNSNGEWKVPTGSCQCRAGFQPNTALTACKACPVGTYKTTKGNHPCTKCPPHSMAHASGASVCHCMAGYYRAKQDTVDQACTRPPSRPRNMTAVVNKTTALVSWEKPQNNGGRDDTYFSVVCEECSEDFETCWSCKGSVHFKPVDTQHLIQTNVVIQDLQMEAYYRVKVMARNGVTSVSKEAVGFEVVTFSTNDAVPSVPQYIVLQSKTDSTLKIKWSAPSRLSKIVTFYEVYAKIIDSYDSPSTNTPRPVLSRYAPTVIKVSTLNCTLRKLEPSTLYEVKVRALSNVGMGQYSEPVVFKTAIVPATPTPPDDSSNMPIIGAVIGVLIILILVIVIVMYVRRRNKNAEKKKDEDRMRAKLTGSGETDPLNQQDLVVLLPPVYPAHTSNRTYVDYRDPHKGVKEQHAKELKMSAIKIEKVIGRGEFGEVCKGKLMTGKKETPVAIKRLKSGVNLVDQTNFLREACTMAQFKHNNILDLKGVVTKSIPPMIISEFMENGSLDGFLQKNDGRFSLIDLLRMLKGIASGMQYLQQMQYVHRDLAARNILVSSDMTCKVSDFGLSRTFENDPRATYTTQGGKIPIRWTAPECFKCRQFTSASDVWSFGIVMWEVLSYGEKPFWDMTNEDVMDSIEKGYRLPAPQGCPSVIHQLMLDCWSYESVNRPTFKDILEQLHQFINNPDMLDDVSMAPASGSLVNPDSPVFKFDDWLKVMNLSDYKPNFQAQGIGNLDQIVDISESDIKRLGIQEPGLRERLQSGIDTLRRHRSVPGSPNALTLPAHGSAINRDVPVSFATSSRSGASASQV